MALMYKRGGGRKRMRTGERKMMNIQKILTTKNFKNQNCIKKRKIIQ